MLRSLRSSALLLLAAACGTGEGCHSCGSDKSEKRRTAQHSSPTETTAQDGEEEEELECADAEECADDSPCTEEQCVDGFCEVEFLAEGTNCDDDTVCNGISTCDREGRCVPGPPPQVDDNNACTTDSCDPVNGVSHEPIPVDDGDACTVDECDPQTGAVTHESVDIDDGDDCTFDRCDPQTGPSHERLKSIYTCKPTCGDGFHAVSRRPHPACGPNGALQTYCSPDCGDSFYTCDARCPDRYTRTSTAPGPQCPPENVSLFCVKK